MTSKKNSRRALLAIGIFLVAVTWVVFGQTIDHQFVNYDDPIYVIENAHVRAGLSWHGIAWAFTHVHSQNWHPLTTISHMLDCQLFGLQPGPHHFISVLVHSMGAVLLFVALKEATGRLWASAFVAATFAIHPLRVESVAWIAERKDVLSGVFFMLTLICYVWYARQPSIRRYVTMSIFFACGLMSKPMLVTTPIVLLLLDYWPLGRIRNPRFAVSGQKNWPALIAEKIPLFALSIASCVATVLAQNFALGSTEYLPFQWRATNAVVAYLEYIREMFWPVGLVPFYVHPENHLPVWRVLVAASILTVITAIALWRRRNNPYLVVGWYWYVVMLLPVIGLVQVGLQGHADRYTYLPQIGLGIAVVWLVCDLTTSWHHQKFALAATGSIVVATLSILAWKQTTYWRDTETLWTHALAVTPDNDVAHAGLAGILFVRGETGAAIEHYEHALSRRDGNVAAHYGLAMALTRERKFDQAIVHFEKALSIQPDNIQASNNLGRLLASKGKISDAIIAWRRTLSFDSENVDAANDLAWALATASDSELRNGQEALGWIQHAIEFGGENARLLRTLAAALAELNRFSEAAATAERAERMAEATGDRATADSLRRCIELFGRGEPLHSTQVSH